MGACLGVAREGNPALLHNVYVEIQAAYRQYEYVTGRKVHINSINMSPGEKFI